MSFVVLPPTPPAVYRKIYGPPAKTPLSPRDLRPANWAARTNTITPPIYVRPRTGQSSAEDIGPCGFRTISVRARVPDSGNTVMVCGPCFTVRCPSIRPPVKHRRSSRLRRRHGQARSSCSGQRKHALTTIIPAAVAAETQPTETLPHGDRDAIPCREVHP